VIGMQVDGSAMMVFRVPPRGIVAGTGAHVPIRSDADIAIARRKCRTLAETIGFSSTEVVLVTTAISELARNILYHARRGEILVSRLDHGGRDGILLVAHDEGPGIPGPWPAARSARAKPGEDGLGLSGIRRVMDEMRVSSVAGKGTTITVKKWKR
jgi:serine/threonine-protein kinase RsbT